MPRNPPLPLLTLLLALLFVVLFHGHGVGLNLLLFETVALGVLWWTHRPSRSLEMVIAWGGTLLSAVLVLLYGSTLAVVVNLFSVVLLAGLLLMPRRYAMDHGLLLGLAHVLPAQGAFLRSLNGGVLGGRLPIVRMRAWLAILAITGIAAFFTLLYSAANPHFERLTAQVLDRLSTWLGRIDLAMTGTFALGLAAGNMLLLHTRHENLLQWMARAHDDLFRRRQHPARAMLGLRYELRTGVVLLGTLNALLLVANVLDIRHVWTGFTFNGQYLKQFVHEGTWLLVLSILLGAAIVLWFFRANQNFHRANRGLRWMAYLWLAQNALLTVSVAIRNYWYIHHYALAYKRIGVVFFLLACFAGLIIVLLKVRDRRSLHYLLRWNAFSAYAILLVMACVDWDVVIARYNFAKKDQSFVHLDYMATLADKALPWLAQEQHALELIDRNNQRMLDSGSFSRTLYMEPKTYGEIIAERTGLFLDEYPKRSWLEWNRADARAHRMLLTGRDRP